VFWALIQVKKERNISCPKFDTLWNEIKPQKALPNTLDDADVDFEPVDNVPVKNYMKYLVERRESEDDETVMRQ
jgi:hypothetical protein